MRHRHPRETTLGGREGSLAASLPLDHGTRNTVPVLPETRYAKSGDVSIAYQVTGEGPFDIVLVPGSVSHVELCWQHAGLGGLMRGLAEIGRLISFDKRGTGMSDRITGAANFEERMDDIRAVLDAAGSLRAALVGISEGAPMSTLFAATYPGRVTALVLYGGMARTLWAPDYPLGTREDDYLREIEEYGRSFGEPGFLEAAIRSGAPEAPDEEIQQLVDIFRHGASPGAALALERMNMSIDVREAAAAVRAPTLVLHKTADTWVSIEQGRDLAHRIVGSRFVELPGNGHIFVGVEAKPIVAAVGGFLTHVWESGGWEEPEPDRVLATVLFSDIVGSSEKAATLGDRAWRELLERHHELVRRQLVRFRGREVDTAGDGFFASFDGPARAIRCGCAINEAMPELGLDVRVGLHTGECELIDGKVAGIAVHTGARVAAQAEPGEVLVSSTVKDLVAGSGLGFQDRGMHELKGIPGEWRLYAVQD